MNQPNKLEKLKGQLLEHKWLLIGPAVGCMVLALGYSLLSSPKWAATQALIIRDESSGQSVKPGRFDSLDQMKTVQETIHETCRNPSVLKEAMLKVGAPKGADTANWPTTEDVERLQEDVSISAPNGAEFGMTEMLHLTVKDKSKQRATILAGALADVASQRFGSLRSETAASMEKELDMAVELNQEQVDKTTAEMEKIEKQVGVDLAELRSLSTAQGGGSLQNTLARTRAELRVAMQDLETLKKQYEALTRAQNDPSAIISTSNELLVAQPSLKKLKDGLIDAQLSKAAMMGRFTSVHPKAKVALQAEKHIINQIREEITAALAGLETQVNVQETRTVNLNKYIGELSDRLQMLSTVRAKYDNLTQELNRARTDLAKSKTDLTEARSIRKASETTSLIVKVDEPRVGSHPEGLGKVTTCFMGLLCGLAIGTGLFIFVTSPNLQTEKRRELINTLLDRVQKRTGNEVEEEVVKDSTKEFTTTHRKEIDQLINQLREYEDMVESKLNS